MSKSRSPSPTRNLSASNIDNSPASTTSRLQTLDESTVQQPSQSLPGIEGEATHSQPRSSSPTALPLQHQPTPESSRKRRRRAEESSSDTSMAKRIRIEMPANRAENRSSPESDSQGDMADNEMDTRAIERLEQVPPVPSPKKKRTRTLTTPHQSAVLHALLAQSRFPTTAMREEVGRAIGLSARKVQIWFQNQRQKARRPRTQGDAATHQPPQYEPFTSAPESLSVHRYEAQPTERTTYAALRPVEPHAGPSNLPPRLLGPGMPGPPIGYSAHGYRQVLPAPPTSAPAEEPQYMMGSSYRTPSGPEVYRPSLPALRPVSSQTPGWRERQRDPSRTLPPLLPSRPSSSHPAASSSSITLDMPSHIFAPPRSASPEHPFAHQPPDVPSRPLHIPPPFTLQPAPQWDESTYLPRPRSSSWSRPASRSTRGRSTSPLTIRRDPTGRTGAGESSTSDLHYQAIRRSVQSSPAPSLSTTTPPRSGRYDPIRSTFIPYPTSITSPAPSPARQGEEDGSGDENE